MKISKVFDYSYGHGHGDWTIEIEVEVAGDHEVELVGVFEVRDASGGYLEITVAEEVEIEASITACLRKECRAGGWDEEIADAHEEAYGDEPGPVWGHAPWAPRILPIAASCIH